MDDYEKLISIVEKNVAKKHYTKEIKQKIVSTIKEQYKFFFTDAEKDDKLFEFYGDNCFGEGRGFTGLSVIPRSQRVAFLRMCYAEIRPVFPIEQTITNPLNEPGRFGRVALHEAVEDNEYSRIKQLLKDGAKPYITDNNGHTPLMMAKISGNTEMVGFLKTLGIME